MHQRHESSGPAPEPRPSGSGLPSDPRTSERRHLPDSESSASSPSRDQPARIPLACFITFSTYGTWLLGDQRGSVDREHNRFATPRLERDDARYNAERLNSDVPFVMGDAARISVDRTIREVCAFLGWDVIALNVRTNHVHLVVQARQTPERVMNQLRSWATRRLCESGLVLQGSKVWTRHGSTRYLWKPEHVHAAAVDVLERQ